MIKLRNIITLSMLLISVTCFSQVIKFSELTNERADREDFKTYISKDGATYNVGDTIHILSPSQSNNEFATINGRFEGDKTYSNVPGASYLENTNIKIESIFATSGNALEPSRVIFHFTQLFPNSTTKLLCYINIEKAIPLKEVKAFGMTSDEALSELKKAKDKLDLQIISQKEYDTIKSNLIKYIK